VFSGASSGPGYVKSFLSRQLKMIGRAARLWTQKKELDNKKNLISVFFFSLSLPSDPPTMYFPFTQLP
jgi:hypothetical protein